MIHIARQSLPWLVVILLCACGACRSARQQPRAPLVAQVEGTLALSGLAAPVRIVRDPWGVPHIYAQNDDDLFFAQGFVQAQDRLFQMDLWRRSVQGRLSEVLGPNFIERDAMTRRIQYRGDAATEWASYGPNAKAIAAAFVHGVNAWVALARERPPESFVLAGWAPEPWSAEDLLNRTDAFTGSGDALDEVFRARLAAAVGVPRARMLLTGDRSFEVAAGVDPATVPALVAEAIRRVGTPPFFLGLSAQVTEGTVRQPASALASAGAPEDAGRTTPRDGLPHDPAPTATPDHPSRRYLVHLKAPGWNVIGATAPWRPGVAIGHNDRVAWTAEPIDADTQDVYVERLNPANPRQVDDNGRWVDIETQKDQVAVRGRKTPVDFYRDSTRHGVIVAFDSDRHLAFALRWSGSEPGTATELGALALDRADSPAAFLAAARHWKMPSRRMVFAEAGRAHGSTIVSLVPVRKGWIGTFPVPGWNGTREWTGWLGLSAPAPPASQKPVAASVLLEAMRLHPDRADALLQRLAGAQPSRDSLTVQRAAIVEVIAERLRERDVPQDAPVLFSHVLAVTEAARRRFNVSARTPPSGGADPFSITFDTADWDRSSATIAPGQSESPDSPHFADLAKRWSDNRPFPLLFTDAAVQARASATLTLVPR